uniref:Uncharacterized protein n=1 Tax=Terrapene triunguis TaxID=2587831 RepID=A0A674JF71_9SAUR
RQPLSLAWGAHGAPSPWPPEPRGLRPRNRAGGRRPTTPALTRTRRPAAPRLSPGPLPAQAPLGRSAPSEPRWPERAGGGPEPGPEPATPSTGPPIQFGASDKDTDLGLLVSEGNKPGKEPPAPGLTKGLVGVSREWELLPPPRPSLAPQPRALALGPAACPPAEPSAYSGERGPSQRPYPELFYGSQPGVAQQVPSPPVESQLNGSFRPGTPSLHPYRSQHLYLQPGPAPGSPAAPVLPGSALLSGVALKGQYVEFSALQAAELAKLPATGLLYQAPPPLPHSPPLRPRPPGPRAAPAPGAAGAEPPLGFLPGLPATGQPEQLPSGPGPRPADAAAHGGVSAAPGGELRLPAAGGTSCPPATAPGARHPGPAAPGAAGRAPGPLGRPRLPPWHGAHGAAPHGDEALPRVPEVQQSWGSSPSGGQSLRGPLQLPPPGPRIQLRRGQPQPAPGWRPAGLPVGRSLLDPQALGAPPPSP